MQTIQIVLDKKLLQATDQAARRTKQNRSALVRDALENTSGHCKSALEKKATVSGIPGGLRRPMNSLLGRRRRHGLPSSPR
jgi:metal-responsive CopG/Arc/MetJ family transcriptional regulator